MQDEVLLRLNEAHVSMTAVLRALKREECSLYNCVASIVDDALFVQQARQGACSTAATAAARVQYGRVRPYRFHPSIHTAPAAPVPDPRAPPPVQVAARFPSLPLFPNLRCGVWYVRPPIADSCYFKSTDGHNGNWSFSTIRLNLNLAQAAAQAGGCLIVDATKRGKVRVRSCTCCVLPLG
jgi:tRNA A64-2'-O-ribosylphosphate transferase